MGLHITVHDYLQKHNMPFEGLTGASKKNLVKHLFERGAFNEKNAANYVAKILNLGRATVFKYLKELRGKIKKLTILTKNDSSRYSYISTYVKTSI